MSNLPRKDRKRVFLFLQGPSSSLFYRLADRLECAGHSCLRINLNAGDWLFWRRSGAVNYRGTLSAWSRYIDAFLHDFGVTDLILLGEERPYHRAAIDAAKTLNVAVTVVEMGYLRPDWVTVEKDGMSSNSRFPNDPLEIRRVARGLPAPDLSRKFSQSFLMEAVLDLSYNLPNVFFSALYPGYRRHGLYHPITEYAGWVGRILASSKERRKAEKLVETVVQSGRRFFVYPLQLETDYQLRSHSPYWTQTEAIEEIIVSFSRHAPDDAELIVKLHPLDSGLIKWRHVISETAKKNGAEARVHYIDGGDLLRLTEASRGLVTVNSTAVLHSLRHCVPVKVLGCAVYDVAGATHQGALDDFWRMPEKPDAALVEDLFKLLAAAIHVRGNFYSKNGAMAAADAIAGRLLRDEINVPGGDCGFVPRHRPEKRRKVEQLAAL
ncbi:capsule biosynthesis protein [Rhizobium nepotum]|uniref:Capsular biosynthesis protein n=1 Tax=Rhizobium nepotum 39/7 TaxID=1368418 RepID=A0ABR5CQE4_9HYPH|nr:capsular biosynthesis protein [Rhizobium nepotum]KJF67037.1 capsular biosynthesis protein [Rhizobium nepotum 39/7]